MPNITLEILVILLLFVANGVFAMSEMAIISARKARLQERANRGDARARTALELATAPHRFLSAVQIGITLIGILAGAFSSTTIAETLAASLKRIPALAPTATPSRWASLWCALRTCLWSSASWCRNGWRSITPSGSPARWRVPCAAVHDRRARRSPADRFHRPGASPVGRASRPPSRR